MDKATLKMKAEQAEETVSRAYGDLTAGRITAAAFDAICDTAERELEHDRVLVKSKRVADRYYRGPDETSGWAGRPDGRSEFDPSGQGNPRVAVKKWSPPSVFDASDDQSRSLFEASRSNMKGFSTHVGMNDVKLKDAGSWNVHTKDWTVPSSIAEGASGSLLPPQLIPSAWPLRYEPTRLFDYFVGSRAETQSITWLQHSSNTSPAAAVAELSQKPDLGPVVTPHTTTFSTIAGLITVSRQMLDDFSDWAGTIPSELNRAVVDAENDAVLNGNGSSPNMLGLLHTPNTLSRVCPTISGVTFTQIDCLVQAIDDLRVGSAYAVADLIVLNPLDWSVIKRIKNSLGSFVLNSVEPNLIGGYDNVFGVPVATTTKCPSGTAVVIDTKIAVLAFTRMGMEIMYNQFGDYEFQHNAVQYRAEERVAIGCAYPAAVCVVTNLNQGSDWSS